MPRHPPNALLTLDRSHCQCSSLFGFGKPYPLGLSPRGVPNLAIRTPLGMPHRQPKSPVTFYNRASQMPSTCSTRSSTLNPAKSWILRKGLSATIWNYAEQFRGRVLRPASRDLSGDARSGNINPAKPPDEGRTFEQRSALWTSRSSGSASRHIFSSQCKQNRHQSQQRRCKPIFPSRISASFNTNRMVELSGIEPLTPCLQSRCSPS